jgi:hypothetical protein
MLQVYTIFTRYVVYKVTTTSSGLLGPDFYCKHSSKYGSDHQRPSRLAEGLRYSEERFCELDLQDVIKNIPYHIARRVYTSL